MDRLGYTSFRKDKNYMVLKGQVQYMFKKSKMTYGTRRLAKALNEQGYKVCRFKIIRIMKQLQLQARYPKCFKATTDSNHNLEVAPNTLNCNFNPEKPTGLGS